MEKDFDGWSAKKKAIDTDGHTPLYHERQVWWCKLGTNIGAEQDGTGEGYSRPVLILKGFSRNVCLVVPLTTSTKSNRYRIPIGSFDGKESVAIISQLRLVDTKRLHAHIGTIANERFQAIRKNVRAML